MIEIQDLQFGYKRKLSLFDGLDLRLTFGNIYGLLGQNGAGKSTLIKILCGQVFASAKHLEVLGANPGSRHPEMLKEIYLVTEEFVVPAWSMKSYVRHYASFYPRFNYEALDTYLQEFSLDPEQKLTNLSYGQKKKFLLSFGLATDCKLLILDEPTNGLDIPSKRLFRKLVAGAIHDERSFLISTHQVRDMETLIDPIIIIDSGTVILNATQEEISLRLSVQRTNSLPASYIYAESGLEGYTVVTANENKAETIIPLELLFNAAVQQPESMHQLFNEVSYEHQ